MTVDFPTLAAACIAVTGRKVVLLIKVAEAAKEFENTQRDLNIALRNELTIIFHRPDICTLEVLHAAVTKWNLLPFLLAGC